MWSLLAWHYGYTNEQILDLTLPQFKARVRDIFEIHAHTSGQSKGRVTRERVEDMQARVRARGVRPPSRIAE